MLGRDLSALLGLLCLLWFVVGSDLFCLGPCILSALPHVLGVVVTRRFWLRVVGMFAVLVLVLVLVNDVV
jgi:hypothetical protein